MTGGTGFDRLTACTTGSPSSASAQDCVLTSSSSTRLHWLSCEQRKRERASSVRRAAGGENVVRTHRSTATVACSLAVRVGIGAQEFIAAQERCESVRVRGPRSRRDFVASAPLDLRPTTRHPRTRASGLLLPLRTNGTHRATQHHFSRAAALSAARHRRSRPNC